MANRCVSIWKNVKVNGKWTYCKPFVNAKNHKPEANIVVVKGVPELHAEGHYSISWYERGKRQWKNTGPKLATAVQAAEHQRFILEGGVRGLKIQENSTPRLGLDAAATAYLEEVQLSRRPETYALYRHDLKEFRTWFRGDYVDAVTRLDLLKYKDWVQKAGRLSRSATRKVQIPGRAPRTAANKMMRVAQFLRHYGRDKLVTVKDAKVVEKMPEVYSQGELTTLFAACTPPQRLLFTTFLQTGCRMQELMFLYWDDLDLSHGTLSVRAKPEFGFTTKTHEERQIPLPTELLAQLAAFKFMATSRLVFPTRTGRPNNKWLYTLKRVAKRAGLNPRDFWLHRFRATFASWCLRNSIDIKSVQYLLGHRNIESTMRYLAPVRNEELRTKVDKVWAKPVVGLAEEGPLQEARVIQ